MGWLSYTAVTPRASLKSDANNDDRMITIMIIYIAYLMGISECKLVGSFPINAPSSKHRRFDF